ncbi:hypothetical protein ACE1SV_54070 [Streptomyces sp. E-15]
MVSARRAMRGESRERTRRGHTGFPGACAGERRAARRRRVTTETDRQAARTLPAARLLEETGLAALEKQKTPGERGFSAGVRGGT